MEDHMGLRTQEKMNGKWMLALIAIIIVSCFWASTVYAAGFAVARFGGEHGHPTTDNLTSIYYNPAGLALSPGTHIFLDGSFALRSVEYIRPESAISNPVDLTGSTEANAGTGNLFNFATVPFMGVSSDFGTGWFTAALAAYAPFGGSATWDENDDVDSDLYPGAVDGVQRWYSIHGSIKTLYITGALAFNIEAANLSIGISGSAISSSMETIRARNADGTDDLVVSAETPTLKEGRSYLNASGWQMGIGVGVLWEAVDDMVWVGASYTSKPNIAGGMTLEGTLENALSTGKPDKADILVTQDLPDIYRFGARVRPTPDTEIRLFADYTRWSVFDKQCVLDATADNPSCDFGNTENALTDPASFGGDADPSVVQHLPRFWHDSFGVRAGGSYWVTPGLELFLGAGYDSSAIPVESMDPVLFDMDKVTASAGLRWQIFDSWAFSSTFTQVFYFEVDTDGQNNNNKYQSPTKQPSADGIYRHSVSVLNIYSDISF
jgi:long-chain fatty acid transport protein